MRRIFPPIALVLATATTALGSSSAFAGWGVIAYNDATGASSESHGWATYQQAVDEALAFCGFGCRIVNWENSTCIALATGFGHWGEGHGFATSTDAVSAALMQCGADCAWKEWACN